MMKQEKNARKEAIFAMFAQGHTYEEIGKAFGVSRQRAQQIVRPPIQVVNALRKRAGDKCERCRIALRLGDFHVHHLDNHITGGYEDLKRVRLLCRSCHKIEDHIKEPEKHGRSLKGIKKSEEARKNMSEAQKRRWADGGCGRRKL